MCDNGIARNLDLKAHGHNNDGIDLEMTRNFLVENCIFDQGDDAVVIKSGSNQDGWRLNTPCENIVIRNCSILQGHTLLGLGSELSSGIRNIYMHNCTAPKSVLRLFYIKTNHRRGGFVENIYMENIKAGKMQRAFEIDTDVLYQWKDFPTYETRITPIHDIHMLQHRTCLLYNFISNRSGLNGLRTPVEYLRSKFFFQLLNHRAQGWLSNHVLFLKILYLQNPVLQYQQKREMELEFLQFPTAI